MKDLFKLSPQDFELLIINLLKTENFYNIEWHGRGGSDRGRDIVAYKVIDLIYGKKQVSKWVIQCKRYTNKISKRELLEDLAAAEEHNPTYWLLCITIPLSSNMLDWLNSQKAAHRFEIIAWDLPQIQNLIAERLGDSQFKDNAQAIQMSKSARENAINFAKTQFSSLESIRRSPFQNIDQIPIEQTIPLYALDNIEGIPDKPRKRFSFDEISELCPFAVVLGEPGSGKSTSMQRLAYKLAASYISNESPYLPICVDLKWFKGGLEDLIKASIRDFSPALSLDETNSVFASEGIYFLLDGFDEATDHHCLLQEIRELPSRYRNLRILITSRPTEALNILPFPFFELAGLSSNQIKQFLYIYLQGTLTSLQLENLFRDMHKYGLFGELRNPMFMWFFSLAIRSLGRLENIRSLPKGIIFKTVIENYFLSRWELKGLKSQITEFRKFIDLKINFLSELAFEMIDANDSLLVDKNFAQSLLMKKLVGNFSDPYELGYELFDQILSHNILQLKNEVISFWHKSLRNYFAATYLRQKEASEIIETYTKDDRWSEPLVLLSSLHGKASDIVNGMMDINAEHAIECVINSPLVHDINIINKLCSVAIRCFFEEKSIAARLRVIQKLLRVYEIEPNLFNAATYSFFSKDKICDLEEKYERFLIAYEMGFKNLFDEMNKTIANYDINIESHYRIKTLSAAARKIICKKISFDEINDIFGIRITTTTVKECYELLGIILSHIKPVPGRFKDYIAMPKSNGYQALHTTVRRDFKVEFILQTKEMYERSDESYREYILSRYENVFGLIDKLQKEKGISVIPVRSFESREENMIAALTPDERVIVLPEGLTVLDFAYKISEKIGSHCEKAIINGREVPLNYPIKNLDQVRVITNPDVNPRAEWVFMVYLNSSRKSINRIIRRRERKEYIVEGMEGLTPFIDRGSRLLGIPKENVLQKIMKLYSCQKPEQLFIGYGSGKLDPKKMERKFVFARGK